MAMPIPLIDALRGVIVSGYKSEIQADDLEARGVFDSDQKRRAFTFVVWPESTDMAALFQAFQNLHVPIAVSPLHDRDMTDDNELKKPHYHVVIRFPNPRYLDPVRSAIGKVLVSCSKVLSSDSDIEDPKYYVQPVYDYPSMIRYLCHLDNPEKARYDVSRVITFGFIDISALYARSRADEEEALAMILSWLQQNPKASYKTLADAVISSGDGAVLRSLRNNSYMIRSYINDARAEWIEAAERSRAADGHEEEHGQM